MLGKAQTRLLIRFICGFLNATTADGIIWKEAKGAQFDALFWLYLQQARRTNNITQSVSYDR
jgi:hypothetical protein